MFLDKLKKFLPKESTKKSLAIRCGADNFIDELEKARVLLTNPTDLNNINNFIDDGGTFSLLHTNKGDGHCDYSTKNIGIAQHHIIDAMKTGDYTALSETISHELIHYDDMKKLDEAGVFAINLNDKGDQKISNALEISVFYKQAVIAFEEGGKKWESFESRHKAKTTFFSDLKKVNILPGNKIPEKYNAVIGDALIRDFCINTSEKNPFKGTRKKDYHEQSISSALTNKRFNRKNNIDNPEDISIKSIFKTIGVPTSFTEKQLEALVLINYDNLGFFHKLAVKHQNLTYSRVTDKNIKNVAKALDRNITKELFKKSSQK